MTYMQLNYQICSCTGREVDISLGKFIAFGDSPEYHQKIKEHSDYINQHSQFHVTGLHADLLKHKIADNNPPPPSIQNIRNILIQFPYTGNHTIIIDEVHVGGLSGHWVLLAPTETLLKAVEHTIYILLQFGTQAPAYQHHISNTTIQRTPPIVTPLTWKTMYPTTVKKQNSSLVNHTQCSRDKNSAHNTQVPIPQAPTTVQNTDKALIQPIPVSGYSHT